MILCVACNLLSKLPAITKGLELAWDLRISQDNLPLRLKMLLDCYLLINFLRQWFDDMGGLQLPATMEACNSFFY